MRWIKGALGGLWRMSRSGWIGAGDGLSPGSGAAALYGFLFPLFLLAGVVLTVVGVNFGDGDRWLDRQAGWLDTVAGAALRFVFALVLILCAVIIAAGLYMRLPGRRARPRTVDTKQRSGGQGEGRIGWGAMALALVIGYFAGVGTFGRH